MSLWKVDPTFTNFVPQNAEEAVARFVRCRDNGLSAMMIPECLVDCSRGLSEEQLDLFEQWIINPSGPVCLRGRSLVPLDELAKANNDIYDAAVRRFELTEDEKQPEPDLAALPMVPAVLQSFPVSRAHAKATATEQTLLARAAESPSATGGPSDTRTTSGAGPCLPAEASG